MTWRFTNVEDVRMKFIDLSFKGVFSFKDLCEKFGISRKTGYKWLNRYREGGKENLSNQKRAPKTRPNETQKEIQDMIIKVRCQFPLWGAKKIIPYLKKKHPSISLPSTATVGNILRRNGYTASCRRNPKLANTSSLIEAKYPNHVWTIDFKGWWKTLNGQVCEPLTIVDLHSKYILYADHVHSKKSDFVWRILNLLFSEYGKPNRIRSDNGPPFASLAVGRLSRLSVNLIKEGIIPEWIRAGKPQDNGSHERMHRTMKAEISLKPASNLRKQREQIIEFKNYFNKIRPHEALNMKTPLECYLPISDSSEQKDLLKYPKYFLIRKADINGVVSIHGHRFFVSELLRGEKLGIEAISHDLYRIYYGPILIGTLHLKEGFKRF